MEIISCNKKGFYLVFAVPNFCGFLEAGQTLEMFVKWRFNKSSVSLRLLICLPVPITAHSKPDSFVLHHKRIFKQMDVCILEHWTLKEVLFLILVLVPELSLYLGLSKHSYWPGAHTFRNMEMRLKATWRFLFDRDLFLSIFVL